MRGKNQTRRKKSTKKKKEYKFRFWFFVTSSQMNTCIFFINISTYCNTFSKLNVSLIMHHLYFFVKFWEGEKGKEKGGNLVGNERRVMGFYGVGGSVFLLGKMKDELAKDGQVSHWYLGYAFSQLIQRCVWGWKKEWWLYLDPWIFKLYAFGTHKLEIFQSLTCVSDSVICFIYELRSSNCYFLLRRKRISPLN